MLRFAHSRIDASDAVMKAAARSAAVQHSSEHGCLSSGDETEIRKDSHFSLYLYKRKLQRHFVLYPSFSSNFLYLFNFTQLFDI